MVSRLFDAAGDDREIELDASVIKRLTDRQLLWVDVSGDDEGELRRVGELFALEPQSIRNLENPIGQPRLDILERYFEVNVVAIGDDERPVPMDLLAGRTGSSACTTRRPTFSTQFRQQLSGDRELGRIEAPSFLAALLDWQLGTYFKLVDELERGVDVLDERALLRRGPRGQDRPPRRDGAASASDGSHSAHDRSAARGLRGARATGLRGPGDLGIGGSLPCAAGACRARDRRHRERARAADRLRSTCT